MGTSLGAYELKHECSTLFLKSSNIELRAFGNKATNL